jgi:hypothetical protein
MRHNPYDPPHANVDMPPPPDTIAPVLDRPIQVTAAMALLGLSLFLAPVRSILRANWDFPLRASVPPLILVGIAILWLYGLHRRKRWVWWLTVILLLVGILGIPWDTSRPGGGIQKTLYFVQFTASTPALILLCLPAVRRWFRVSAANKSLERTREG